jgi:hypothetical protein
MRFPIRSPFARTRSTALAGCAALFFALSATQSLVAQTTVVAFYPLLTDLFDATANNGPVALIGNGVPAPLPPNNGVCHNGVYYYSTGGGQDIRTPLMPALTTTDFQVNVEFNLAALPTTMFPVLMGGNSYRWLGIYVQANGTIGIKHNNSNLAWSTTTVTTGNWYSAGLRYEAGNAELFLNGVSVLVVAVGVLNDGNNKNFTTNDFSNGRALNGCIRNLLVVNDPTAVATAAMFGAGCQGSAGVPSLTPANSPQLGITFNQNAANLEPNGVYAFMAIGLSDTAFVFGPLPFNLQAFGLGAGCNLLCSADVALLFPVVGGSGTFSFAVPMNPGLGGVTIFYQCASIDPGATGGLAVSNGVRAAIGF